MVTSNPSVKTMDQLTAKSRARFLIEESLSDGQSMAKFFDSKSNVGRRAGCEPEPGERILRLPQVLQRTGLSKATIARREAEGLFPTRRRLRGRAVGWLASEVDSWIASLEG
jgi:prophage regulatory protein